MVFPEEDLEMERRVSTKLLMAPYLALVIMIPFATFSALRLDLYVTAINSTSLRACSFCPWW